MSKQPKRFSWLAVELADRGYQQKDLAKAWGIDDAVVTRFIATGKPDLTPERMIALARMLEMDYNELMGRMYADAPRRSRVAVSPMPVSVSAPAPRPNGSDDVQSVIQEINRGIAQLRRMLPGASVKFSIDYGEGQ